MEPSPRSLVGAPTSEQRPGTRLGVLVGATRYFERAGGEPKFCLDLLDLDREPDAPRRLRLDFLAHGFAVQPRRPGEAALLEKQGPGGCYVDLVARRVLAPIVPLAGHAFYGHGVFAAGGSVLLAIETELATQDGTITIRDATTFRVIDTVPTYGKAPHDCLLLDEGRTLAITNGGGAIDTPDLGCVCFVDLASRQLLERHEVPSPRLNAGHLAMSGDGRGFALVSAPRSGLPEASLGGVSIRRPDGPLRQRGEPRAVADRLVGESLSVCVHRSTRTVVATHPLGHLVTFWSLDTEALLGVMSLPHPRGVTLTSDGRVYAIAYGTEASLLLLEADGLKPVEGHTPGSQRFSGSHVYTWAYPA